MNRKFGSDMKGIEGFPLKLLIVVIIAILSLSVVMGFFIFSSPTLSTVNISVQGTDDATIEVTGPDGGEATGDATVIVKAYDNDNGKLSDVTVILKGCGVSEVGKTKDGKITFENIDVTLPAHKDYGEIEVRAKHNGGMGEVVRTGSILVKRN